MALINTLRNKAGKFVVFMVGAAIAAFTLNDLFGSGSSWLMGENEVGEINGQSISIQEYQQELQYQENSFRLYANRNPTESDKFTINDQTWRWLISNYAYSEQYDKLGMNISREEIWDMLQGENIDPTIRMFFSDPQTGQFDRQAFYQFMRNPDMRNQQSQFIWSVVFRSLGPSRERLKYENLIIKSTYANSAEGEAAYHAQSDIADLEFLYIPYYSMSDTAVQASITDDMISDYYKDNKESFKVEHQKNIEYVYFPIEPSPADTAEILAEIEELKQGFVNTADDSSYAYINTEEAGVPFGRYHHGIIPTQLKDQLDSLRSGEVYGPYLQGNTYKLFKVGEIYDDSVSHTRARHIFFRASNETLKENVRQEADTVLKQLQNGANFALMARQYSDDTQSNQMGGDLGWIPSNADAQSQEELLEAINKAETTGLIPEIIETDLGLHIVDITGEPTSRMYEVATIDRSIIPSNKTIDEVYRKADVFQSQSEDLEAFRKAAEENGYEIYSENEVTAMDRFIGDLGNARQIVQWAFRDGEVGKVSDIYEINDNYVIAAVTAEVEEGYMDLDFEEVENGETVYPVREEIRDELSKKLKAEKIIARLKEMNGSLEEIKNEYGGDAEVYSSADLKFESNSMPVVGFDPVAVGTVFSLENGQTSEPFSTENGVYIVKLNNLTVAPEVADYSAFSLAVQTTRQNSIRNNERIDKLIREDADIEDKRYLVY